MAWNGYGSGKSNKGKSRPSTGNYALGDKPKKPVSLPKLKCLEDEKQK